MQMGGCCGQTVQNHPYPGYATYSKVVNDSALDVRSLASLVRQQLRSVEPSCRSQ